MKLYQIECENTMGMAQEIVAGFNENEVFEDVYYTKYLQLVIKNNCKRMSFNSFVNALKKYGIIKPFKSFIFSYQSISLDKGVA